VTLSPIPKQAPPNWKDRNEQDIKALYEYLGRLRQELEARLTALETP
jgi:hypothetical protein